MTQNYREELLRELLESFAKPWTEEQIIASINAAMDCSGSISQEKLQAFEAEIKEIMYDLPTHTMRYTFKSNPN